MENITRAIANVAIFSGLSFDDCDAIARLCHPGEIQKGTVIALEGSDADKIFIIIKGQVHIWVEYGTENADLLAITDAPALVGEMSVIDELPRSATVVANTDVYAYCMDAKEFRKLLKERGNVSLSLLKGLSHMIRMSNDAFINELRLHNSELSKANKELHNTQEQLMRKERLSSLGRFSAMIMHDLKNPLFAIIAYLDFMSLKLDTKLGDYNEVKTYLEHIRRETNRISKLTNEWLDYSNGEPTLVYTPINIDELFIHLQENIDSIQKTKEMTFLWQNKSTKKLLIDVDRILRVLVNLVDNAIKSCSKGSIITISAIECGDYVRLNVQDNGTGMTVETRQHIFEPFFTQSRGMGSGLGMYIVKTITEAHKGWVEVNSTLGKGTTVSLYLPMSPKRSNLSS